MSQARWWMMLLPLLLLQAVRAIAQDPAPTPAPGSELSLISLLPVLIPFAVPMFLALVKQVVESVPAWWLPYMAAGLGALADVLIHVASGGDIPLNPVLGGILGSAGVGLREIYSQTKQRIADGPKPAKV